MFIKLKYGPDKECPINANCSAKNLLKYVATKCSWDKVGILDVVDIEGKLAGVSKLEGSAMGVVTPRVVYVAVVFPGRGEEVSNTSSELPHILLPQSNPTYNTVREAMLQQRNKSAVSQSSRLVASRGSVGGVRVSKNALRGRSGSRSSASDSSKISPRQ